MSKTYGVDISAIAQQLASAGVACGIAVANGLVQRERMDIMLAFDNDRLFAAAAEAFIASQMHVQAMRGERRHDFETVLEGVMRIYERHQRGAKPS